MSWEHRTLENLDEDKAANGEDENVMRVSTTVMKWESKLHGDDLAKFNRVAVS